MRRFDIAAMFGSLWLLASMLIDALTPKELTVYMIGAAIAPATAISAILYWLRVPPIDFAVVFSTLWMVSAMVIELITPGPLSPLVTVVALAPMAIVGIVINALKVLRPIPDSAGSSFLPISSMERREMAYWPIGIVVASMLTASVAAYLLDHFIAPNDPHDPLTRENGLKPDQK